MCDSSRQIRAINIQTKCYTKKKAECNILKEVLSCCRGLESDVIKFEEPGYTVPQDIFLESSQIINQLLELAYLYRSAKHLIGKQQNSMVADGLVAVIQKHLADYEMKIAIMWCSKNSYQESKHASLKKALPWARESMIILQFIVTILNMTQHLRGGAILNPLLKYENHANKNLSSIFKSFISGASKPLYAMLKYWIFKGVINDPKEEFFIYENKELYGRNRWDSQFMLRPELIPNKFTVNQANLIVDTGKCVYFLKQYWSETTEYKNAIAKLKQKFECLVDEEIYAHNPGENSLILEIRKIHLLNTQYVLEVLKKDYNLLNFFTNLHHYILLGQGDFARRFMEAMQQLEERKCDRLDVVVGPLLRNTLHSIAEGQKKSDWLNNIHVHKNNLFTSEETIFEAFSLRYSIKGPLKMIFQAYEKDYHLLFIFLWRKTYIQYKLSSIARDLFCLKKYEDCQSGFNQITKELYFLKYQLTNFMFHLEYYIVHEVIEKEWYYFLCSFDHSTSIDDVIKAHERMLTRIFMGTLMDTQYKKLNIQIKVIFDLIEEFHKLVNNLLLFDQKENINISDKFKLRAKINVLSTNYMKSVKSFKRFLKTCHHIDSLSAVYDRIDFNKFYTISN
ncbi:gamma-tubulin complex component 3 homolog [Rhodnius prolixus]|uniref:gamma-tubulin complex component 3 homolog n=1 Tax=Rhodnius prolixus TaxID=13249 RepID=UPI003D18DA26